MSQAVPMTNAIPRHSHQLFAIIAPLQKLKMGVSKQ